MVESQIIEVVRSFLTQNIPLESLMKSLPDNTEIRIHLDGRYSGVLGLKDSAVAFYDEPLGAPEFELKVSSEAVRRITSVNPSSLAILLEELARESLAGNLVWKINASPKELWQRGHVLTAKRLYPHIQAEVFQKLMFALGAFSMVMESAKEKIRSVLK
jgi:hypothetical protein